MNQPQAKNEELNERHELEKWIAGRIGVELQRTYPRLRWGVVADTAGQVVIIICPFVSQTKGYYLHMNKYTIHQLTKRAVEAAGEILERHGIARKQTVNTDHIEAMPRDLRDNVIATDAAPEPIKKCH